MAYTVVSQNNTVTKMEDDQGNVIHVPAIASLAKSNDYTIKSIKNSTATLEHSNGKTYKDVPCVVVLADDSSNYTKLSQKNTKATLENTDSNVIHVPSKVILASSTDYTLIKVNNSTATLEDGSGNIIRDIPCVSLLTDENNTISTLNNSTASVLDGSGQTVNDVPCVVVLLKASGGVVVIIKGTSPLVLPDAIANSLSYVKAFGGTEQRNLPDGYTQLEYIESTGTQYIVPDVSGDARWVITAQANAVKGSSQSLISSTPSASGGTWYGEFTTTRHWDIVSNGTNIPPTTKTTADLTFDGNGARGTIGSTSVDRVASVTQGAWCIFTTIGGGSTYSFAGKLFDAKVYQNGTLVRDLVAAKNSSNTVGMYDIVNDVFYENAGTGDFTAGPEVVPTPDAPMDIVSNNGVLKLSPNLVDYNETRINGTTWASADKTKGFEVEAAVYGKNVGDSVIVNANCFGAFVPCKQGESVSINFFDYTPMGSRCFYCEVDADGKATTTPDRYATNQNVLTQQTFTITQPDSIGFVIEWYISVGRVRNYTKENYMIVRGISVPTAYIPYGQIYTDGTVETINVHGKNLFDKNTALLGDLNTSGAYVSRTYRVVSDYIPVKFGQTFVGSGTLLDTNGVEYAADIIKAFYKADKSYIAGTRGAVTGGKVAIDDNECAYIRVVFYNGSLTAGKTASIENSTLQLEEGNTPTAYQPYFDGGTATAEMLLKVGDYQDVQSIIDGAVTRNVGVYVFDGTESFVGHTTIVGFVYLVVTSIAENVFDGFCSHYARTDAAASNMPTNTFRFSKSGSNNRIVFRDETNASGTGSTARDNFKSWLAAQYAAGTPVILLYPLATPTTETVAGQALQVTGGDNVLEITQASLDGLELEATYNKS